MAGRCINGVSKNPFFDDGLSKKQMIQFLRLAQNVAHLERKKEMTFIRNPNKVMVVRLTKYITAMICVVPKWSPHSAFATTVESGSALPS